MNTFKYEELDSQNIKSCISEKLSFEVVGLSGRMGSAVSKLENLIELSGFSCRVYTAYRMTAIGGSFFGGITGLAGIASAIGIAAHNIATFNPDYEICKQVVDNKLIVTYKK